MALFKEDKDVLRILKELLDEEKEQSIEDSSDDELSDVGEEVIRSEHESESEQEFESAVSDSDESGGKKSSDTVASTSDEGIFYIGKNNCKWRKRDYSSSSKTKGKNIIEMFPGRKEIARDIVDEATAFHKILDTDMVDEIVKFTNDFIKIKNKTLKYNRKRDAKETSSTEILALFGVLYILGLKKTQHTNVLELWTTDGTGIQILRAVMSYKRFLFLLRCLRFDNRASRIERKKDDKLAPLRTILDRFVANCENSYNLSEFVTIDEKLEPFRGRCSFIQYIPSKPAKYGIKIFALCDAKTFYTSKLEVHCGKQPPGPYMKSNSPSDIVDRLVSSIVGTNRNITMDNWYTNYPLAKSLLQKKLTCIGTLRKNQTEIPPEFLPQKNRVVDTSVFGFQQNVTLVSYVPKKNKAVILMSTLHNTGTVDESSTKPHILLDYNMTKGGVDTVDQMCSSYSVSRITRRWPLALFFSLMNVAGINAQILYYSNPENPKLSRRNFLKNLALSLMKVHLKDRARNTSLPVDISTFLKLYREEEVLEPSDEPAKKKRGRCVVCGRGKNINTTITCDTCKTYVCKKHVNISYTCHKCVADSSS